jgi:Trypsin-co-occurring domain 1
MEGSGDPGAVMGRLVEFGLPDGDTVLVEVAGPQVPTVRGMDGGAVAERAQMTFEAAVSRIKPAVQGMIGQLRELSEEPDEVQIEFGLDLHAEAGAFVAQASADANFSVVLTWRHESDMTEGEQSDG